MRGPAFDRRYLAKMAKYHRLARRGLTKLSKEDARALCTQAANVAPITKVPEHKPRWKQYWKAYHDYTKI